MKSKSLENSIVGTLVVLFLYTTAEKLINWKQFLLQLKQSPILSPAAQLFGWVVPTIEITIIILLLIPGCRLKGLYSTLVIIILFTVYLLLLSTYTYYIPCSCGGILDQLPLSIHVAFNCMVAIVSLLGILNQNHLNQHKEK